MYTLYIGNKNHSTWSLRPWVLMKTAGITFREQRIALYESDSPARIRVFSPSGKVPCLHDGADVIVWDSLAIAEYLAERHPGLWPRDDKARAWARSATAEMHSGFADLRREFDMNLRVSKKLNPSPPVAKEIARIEALWSEGRERFGGTGDFLCGEFGIVDAFFCPVAFRFAIYHHELGGIGAAYQRTLLALPAMRDWAADAAREPEVIARAEPSMATPGQP